MVGLDVRNGIIPVGSSVDIGSVEPPLIGGSRFAARDGRKGDTAAHVSGLTLRLRCKPRFRPARARRRPLGRVSCNQVTWHPDGAISETQGDELPSLRRGFWRRYRQQPGDKERKDAGPRQKSAVWIHVVYSEWVSQREMSTVPIIVQRSDEDGHAGHCQKTAV